MYQRILGTIAIILVIFRLIVEGTHDGIDSDNNYDAYDTYLVNPDS
uniref:SFRICE_012851 n=1 Tax=Spodoptera frugiperda TaxID=7108 RepID=A0A2H1WFG7_SPOFR